MNAIINAHDIAQVTVSVLEARHGVSRPKRAFAKTSKISKAAPSQERTLVQIIQQTPVADYPKQQQALLAYDRAQRDIDWILAMSEPALRRIEIITNLLATDNARLTDHFQIEKASGRSCADGSGKRTSRARYLARCQEFLMIRQGIDTNKSEVQDEIGKAFRLIGLSVCERTALIDEVLTSATPTAEPRARSLAIMMRQALHEADTAREFLENGNQRLVLAVARKALPLARGAMELSDLIAEGQPGLRRAIEKFEPARGHKFSTYAIWWIRQSITRAIQDKASLIRIPVHAQESHRKTVEDETSPIHARIVSLDTPLDGEDDRTLGETLADNSSHDIDHNILQRQIKRVLADALQSLSNRERFVIGHRFGIGGQDMDIAKIAQRLDLTKERVRQIEREAMRKLAEHQGMRDLRMHGLA